MVIGGSGLCRTTHVRFIVLSLFMYISGSPTIIVTGSTQENIKVVRKARKVPELRFHKFSVHVKFHCKYINC